MQVALILRTRPLNSVSNGKIESEQIQEGKYFYLSIRFPDVLEQI